MLPSLGQSSIQTMSSREIADLLEVRHDNVKRSIDRLALSGVIGVPPTEEYLDTLNRPAKAYRICKRDTYVIVAQLCPAFTARLVDRWQELEAAVMPKLPTTFAEALRLAAEQAETIEKQAAAIEAAKPSVAFVQKYGTKGFREVCKLLQANEARFRDFLLSQKIWYRLGSGFAPVAAHLNAGRFIVKTGVSEKTAHAFNQPKFTSKGVAWIAQEWAAFNEVFGS